MWDLIMSLFSAGQEQAMGGGSDAFKDAGDTTMGMDSLGSSGFSTMDKLGDFGKEQLNNEFSMYKNGLSDLKNMYEQLKNGNGLLSTTPGTMNPSALSSAARLFSDKGLLGGGDPVMPQMPQISVMQGGNLGMPTANIQTIQNRQVQPYSSNLARQAYGNFY